MRCEHADLLAVVATNHRPQTVATVLVLCVIGCVLIMVLCTFLQWVTKTFHSILTTTLISPSCAPVSGHMDDKQSSMQPDEFCILFYFPAAGGGRTVTDGGMCTTTSQRSMQCPATPLRAVPFVYFPCFLKKKTLHTHCCVCFHLPGLKKWNEGITLDSFLALDQCC